MLQKDVQTLSSLCLSPVKIFCSTSSTSVPTQIGCAWLPRWKDVQIKGPITASVTPVSYITGEFGWVAEQRSCVILVDDVNILKYCGAWSAARTKDVVTCVDEFHSVITCDMRLLSRTIRGLSVISYGSWTHFPSYFFPDFGDEDVCVDLRFLNTSSLSQCCFLSLIQSRLTIICDTYCICVLERHTASQSKICSGGTFNADFLIWAPDGVPAN